MKASLENISLAGALTHVDNVPPATSSVWVCLDGNPPSAWVESQVVEIVRERWGPALVRLKFEETCPFGFFNSATRPLLQDGDGQGDTSDRSGNQSRS